MVLLGSVPHKEVVVGEGLQPSSLPYREAAHLTRIGVDVVVTVFGDVRDDGGRGVVAYLNPESVFERTGIRACILMIGKEPCWEVSQLG